MIESVLIANRGEIACRIIRTARRMGIRTVAIHSDADANALHVRQADEAVYVGPSPVRDSYLASEKIIGAATATGAQAIHPGYGFLSENSDFAQAVMDAGIVWVGPSPASIRAMGLKDSAKEKMIAAGVPVTPGYLGADQSLERLATEAANIGYPVLIKAVAGGGGKGMRRVDAPEDLADALLSCQREAASSFGNPQVLIEKYILSPRHIEVQVFGDTHGNVVHLFERDCSLQRRHQKVVEEAPAPGMDRATRDAICATAVKAARAVDYVGAGTIEFIADASAGLRADCIWFMEMNTRLQVEHPVTEQITGQDLVEWQLRVASGEPLPKRQDELSIDGWAMEARLYAENPASGFLPSTGPLDHLVFPADVRVDSGVEQGDEVTSFYDPMIAKLIAHAPSREAAAGQLAGAAAAIQIWPIKTNAAFLARTLSDPDFISGKFDTGLIERCAERLLPSGEPSGAAITRAARALVDKHNAGRLGDLAGFRANAPADRSIRIAIGDQTYVSTLDGDGEGAVVEVAGQMVLFENGLGWSLRSVRTGNADAAGGASDGAIVAPMPGRIIAVEVTDGSQVSKGQKLLVLEAMKMEHAIQAPFDGVVAGLGVGVGAQVSEGMVLAKIVERIANGGAVV